jgi:hypothetical protein
MSCRLRLSLLGMKYKEIALPEFIILWEHPVFIGFFQREVR